MKQRPEIEIRKALPQDIKNIARLENIYFSAPWSEKQIEDQINKSSAVFLAADYEKDFAGYVSADIVAGECYINNIAVDAVFQRQGVAQSLLNELISFCKKNNCIFVTLEVRKSNFPAIILYEKTGFVYAGERKNFYSRPDENALIYTLNF